MPRRRRNNKRSRSVDTQLISYAKATGANTTVISSDSRAKVQNFNIVQRPPPNWLTMTYWCKGMYDATYATSTSAINEQNQSFLASSFNLPSGVFSTFDQFCLYEVTATMTLASSATAYTTPVQVVTAIDYDNVNSVGSTNTLMEYGTAQLSTVSMDTSLVRSLKPCVAPVLYNTGVSVSATGVGRFWVDSASYGNVPHYGFRLIMKPTASSQNIEVVFSGLFGFRNSF